MKETKKANMDELLESVGNLLCRIEKLEGEITNLKMRQLYPQPPYIIYPSVSIPSVWINEPCLKIDRPYYEITIPQWATTCSEFYFDEA